jgi:peptide/nickel transport system substrate-binding protein
VNGIVKSACALLIVIVGLAAALAAPGAFAGPGPMTVVVPVPNEPRTLNPDWQADTGGYYPSSNIYCHLVVMDWGVTKGTPVYGDLAERWTTDASGRVYTFNLRRNARWHDGRPVTSADVKYTFDTIMEKRYPLRAYLEDVKEIRVPAPNTLVIELNQPDAAWLPMLGIASNWFGKILPKHLYEGKDWDRADVNARPVGCGPFKFVEWQRGSHVTLEANPDYYGGRPRIDQLVFRVIADPLVAYAEFRAGRFPFLGNEYNPPYAEIATQLMKDPTLEVIKTPSIYSRDLYLNLRKPPLNNPKVREAIAKALDRRAMNQLAFYGIWKPSSYAGIEAVSEVLNKQARFPEANTFQAEQLLEEAGLKRGADGVRFRLSITNYPVADSRAIAEVAVQQLKRVGVDARWEQFDTQTWLTRLRQGNFDISTYFVRYGPAADAYREHFATGAPRNFMGYSNPEVDQLLEQARRARDAEQRRQLYGRVQAILVRDMPYINLFEETKFSLARKGWKGFPTQADSFNKAMTWFGFRAVVPGE